MNYLSLSYIKEKWQHTGFQKYFQNTGWMFFAKIGSLIVSFVATAYIARNLGPTNYGELSYAISFVGLFSVLASLGIDQILHRDLIKFPDKRNIYLGTSIILRMISSILTVLLCIIFAVFLSSKDVSFILIIIIAFGLVVNSFNLLNYEFQADAQAKYPSILSFGIVLFLNILKIIIIFLNQGVIYLGAIILLESILYAIGYIYIRKKFYGPLNRLTYNSTIAKSILKDSLPLIFATAFIAIYSRIDQVMIKNMMNSESVGLYDSAVRISEMWYFIPNLIIVSLFPAIVNAKTTSNILYYKRVKKLFLFLLLISSSIALTTTLLSKYIITLIFGIQFTGAIVVLNIYIWSNISASINLFVQQLLITENYSKLVSITTFFGMFTNILFNLILIPKYGIAGAAIATLISYTMPIISLILFKKTRLLLINIFKSQHN